MALDSLMQLQYMDDLHHNTMFLQNKQDTNMQIIYLYIHTKQTYTTCGNNCHAVNSLRPSDAYMRR